MRLKPSPLAARILTTWLLTTAWLASALVTHPAGLHGTPPEIFAEAAPADCVPTGCRCGTSLRRTAQGQYCGGCRWSDTGEFVITQVRNESHIYECSPMGDCCDYGYVGYCAQNLDNGIDDDDCNVW